MSESLDALRSAVEWACQPQNASHIERGRSLVLSMPRPWVLEHVEAIAAEVMDLSDYWEYRRLLELADLLDAGLVRRLASLGADSPDPDVRDASHDYLGRDGE